MAALSRLHRDLMMMNDANVMDARTFLLCRQSARSQRPIELSYALVGKASALNASVSGAPRMVPSTASLPAVAETVTPRRTSLAEAAGAMESGEDRHRPTRGPKVFGPNYQLTDDDIICGRHKLAFNNTGNKRFRALVADAIQKYFAFPRRDQRSRLIQEIIQFVEASGGQFLNCSKNGSWVELDATEKRNKVGHALRDTAGSARLFKKKFHIKEPVPPFVPKSQLAAQSPPQPVRIPIQPVAMRARELLPFAPSALPFIPSAQAVIPVLPDHVESKCPPSRMMVSGSQRPFPVESSSAMKDEKSSGKKKTLKHRIVDKIKSEEQEEAMGAPGQYDDASEDEEEPVGRVPTTIGLDLLMSLPYFANHKK